MNKYPAVHNAMWPGLVGKGPDSEPFIDLETMLDLTANAEVNGARFDGVDLFLSLPHTSIDSTRDELKQLTDSIARRNLVVGSLVAPVWGPTGGGSAMGSEDERKAFLTQVKKACEIGKTLRELGIRKYGVIRIDSSTSPSDWAADPASSSKQIARTFSEACTIAEGYGERLAAEGEICWGGMHSWKRMVELLELVNKPKTLGFQADMAHSLLYTLGYNAPEDRLLPPDFDWKQKDVLMQALRTVTDALRPWTIDFHVAQNDGTVKGTGSHDKTGRHCTVEDPNGRMDILEVAGLWMRNKDGSPTRAYQHICWDGCMFPNSVMMAPQTWNDILGTLLAVRNAHGVELMARKNLNIGLVGYGFMGRTHSNAFLQAPHFFDLPYQPVLKAVCARSADRVKGFADNWGYESIETDWRAMVARRDIDLIDIASPNDTHAEIAIAAAKAGKMVMCEKPLGRTAAEADSMVAAVQAANVPNMVWYNYRRVPAVVLLKQLLDEGRFGRIFHYRSQFLQDWTISTDLPQGGEGLWRLDVSVAGSGVTGDLLAHNIDMALWLNGPVVEVSAMTETFIKERKHSLTGKVEPVGIDDASAFLCRFANGSMAIFEATRYARGHKALFTLEVNGEKASASWDLHDLHRLEYFDHRDESRLRGWKNVHITDGDHPYMKNWWVPGLQIGYEHTFIHQVADFLTGIGNNKPAAPTFADGAATEYVTDAVLKSAKTRQWEKVTQAGTKS